MDDSNVGMTVREYLKKIDDKLTYLGQDVNAAMQRLEERTNDKLYKQEERLRGVEKWKYALPPTLVLAVASLLVAATR